MHNKMMYPRILLDTLDQVVEPLDDSRYLEELLDRIGDKRFVLIGEASHGTKEFYTIRAQITRHLILKKGFMAIAIEADWPDAYRIHRYVQGKGEKHNVEEALSEFMRFPTWMWRNASLPPFLSWLREYNDLLSYQYKISFFGLDLYSLYTSMQAVIQYLATVDHEAAKRARERYACFDHIATDPQQYGYLTSLGMKKSCAKESLEQLLELQTQAFNFVRQDNLAAFDDYFSALQNAISVKDAENYYRTLYEGRVSSWNLRDHHMAESFELINTHLEKRFNKESKIIIWAHNSHVGDARATEMGEKGEYNIGQLIRERYPEDTYLIGFSTYQGFVTAASNWDEPPEHKRVSPGMPGSYEELFHSLKHKNFCLDLKHDDLEQFLKIPRLQRAIGVIYRPDTERISHYFFTRLAYQFDSLIHIDKTTAVKPLDKYPSHPSKDLADTYPEGL